VALLFAGLLWTHTRSSYLALAVGLVVYALARGGEDVRARVWLAAAAVAVVGLGSVFVAVYTDIGPATTFTEEELVIQRADAEKGGEAVEGISDASTESHWASLRAGIRTVVRHPQGYGLGNAGSTATRTDADVKAGESTYTELGVDTGLIGGLLFVAWSVALLWSIRCAPLVLASFAAVLALGLQTDVIGVPWIACVIWALAGSRVLVPDDG
jgi:O-antigen ligase